MGIPRDYRLLNWYEQFSVLLLLSGVKKEREDSCSPPELLEGFLTKSKEWSCKFLTLASLASYAYTFWTDNGLWKISAPVIFIGLELLESLLVEPVVIRLGFLELVGTKMSQLYMFRGTPKLPRSAPCSKGPAEEAISSSKDI